MLRSVVFSFSHILAADSGYIRRPNFLVHVSVCHLVNIFCSSHFTLVQILASCIQIFDLNWLFQWEAEMDGSDYMN